MPKFFYCLIFSIFLLTLFAFPVTAFSASPTSCGAGDTAGLVITPNMALYGTNEDIIIEVSLLKPYSSRVNPDATFDIAFLEEGGLNPLPSSTKEFSTKDLNKFPLTLTLEGGLRRSGVYTLEYRQRTQGNLIGLRSICVSPNKIRVRPEKFNQLSSCQMDLPKNIQHQSEYKTTASVEDISGVGYYFEIFPGGRSVNDFSVRRNFYWPRDYVYKTTVPASNPQITIPKKLDIGDYTAVIKACTGPCQDHTLAFPVPDPFNDSTETWGCAIKTFSVTRDATSTETQPSQTAPGGGKEQAEKIIQRGLTGKPVSAAGKSCEPEGGGAGTGGIATAIGCIPTEPKTFVEAVLKLAAGAGGGIALLLMVAGAFRMITSAGNPEAIKKGGEQFTSAIIGLLFILFSVLLLKFIGVDILGLGAYLGY